MAVVGGLVVSQFLTLYLTPVIYIYMDIAVKWAKRVTGYKPKAGLPPASPTSAAA